MSDWEILFVVCFTFAAGLFSGLAMAWLVWRYEPK